MSRHPWYTPSGLVARVLYEIALRAPNDTDMIIAAAYGVVEICGVRRALKPILTALKERLFKKRA